MVKEVVTKQKRLSSPMMSIIPGRDLAFIRAVSRE
jgi:hypothetical protein